MRSVIIGYSQTPHYGVFSNVDVKAENTLRSIREQKGETLTLVECFQFFTQYGPPTKKVEKLVILRLHSALLCGCITHLKSLFCQARRQYRTGPESPNIFGCPKKEAAVRRATANMTHLHCDSDNTFRKSY